MPKLSRPERTPIERDIVDAIRERLSKIPEVTLFRNNVGMLEDRYGSKVRYGLAVGSADLIGSLTVNAINYDDEGRQMHIARALAIEVKMPGKHPTPEQIAWLEMVRKAGWLVGVCRSVEEAEELIARGMRWEI